MVVKLLGKVNMKLAKAYFDSDSDSLEQEEPALGSKVILKDLWNSQRTPHLMVTSPLP